MLIKLPFVRFTLTQAPELPVSLRSTLTFPSKTHTISTRLNPSFSPVLLPDVFLRKLPRLRSQHLGYFNLVHVHLITNGDQTLREEHIILRQELNCHHEKVNVVEDEGSALRIKLFLLHEVNRLFAPMTKGMKVMRGVPTVIEAESIALLKSQWGVHRSKAGAFWNLRVHR